MRGIYLDHAATTPLRDEVRAAMDPYLDRRFGNASSVHGWGREARAALDDARERIAELLGAATGEIHFVRGGTEANNLAILGRAEAVRQEDTAPLLVVSAVEHRSVLEAAGAAGSDAEVVRLPVDRAGRIPLDELDRWLERSPAVVSIMSVNNEVGIELPVGEAAERCRKAGVPIHTDAVQAVGKIPVRVDDHPVDLLTATGHKIGGPKSTAILYRREGTELHPRLFGGGQEEGLRPGTEDVAGAVGMAEALELAIRERSEEADRLTGLRRELEDRLTADIPDLRIHGAEASRAPHVVNVGIPGVDLEPLLMGLDLAGIAVSSGSACSSGAVRTSHVLRALYGDDIEEVSAIRFSLGRTTDREDVLEAAAATVRTVERTRTVAA